MQQIKGITPTATQSVQAQLAAFLDGPVIEAAEPAWHPSRLTDYQRSQREEFELAMRAGQLRRAPTCFGGLDDIPTPNRKPA
jgi:hypothetical protein